MPAARRIFFQTPAYDGFQLARTNAPPLEGDSLAHQHFVEDQTECVDVGAGIRRSAFPLLRRHIGGCAHHHSFGGECLVSLQRRQPEIQDLHPGFGQHHVAGLQIAVDDALFVRRLQRGGDLPGVTNRLFLGQRTLFQPGRDGLPLHQFHHKVVRPDVVKNADVGVIQ